MKNFALTIVLLFFIFSCKGQSQISLDSTTLEVDTIVTGLDVPWDIQWGPDDHIWMTERFGRISRVDPINKSDEILVDISDKVYQASESGLLGLVLHPDFPDSAYVYTVYTYLDENDDVMEKLVRFEYDGFILENEETIFDGITGNTTHDGSRLVISPDRKIFMSTGDARNTSLTQDLSSTSGKILRLNLDGSIPDNNPIPGNPAYSWGHRNPQGLYFHPNGQLFSSEHGPSNDDEFQIIHEGRNYGWPDVDGFCDNSSEQNYCNDSNIVEPLVAWTPTIAPSDLIYYDHEAIPEWENTFLMAVLKDKKLIRFELNETEDSVISETHYFGNNWGRLRDIVASPDGTIYLATNGESWSNTDPFTHSILSLKNVDYLPNNISHLSRNKIQIWPTPSKGTINYKISQAMIGKSYEIYDMYGKIIKSDIINELEGQITIESNPGIYFLRIDNRDTKKIMIR